MKDEQSPTRRRHSRLTVYLLASAMMTGLVAVIIWAPFLIYAFALVALIGYMLSAG